MPPASVPASGAQTDFLATVKASLLAGRAAEQFPDPIRLFRALAACLRARAPATVTAALECLTLLDRAAPDVLPACGPALTLREHGADALTYGGAAPDGPAVCFLLCLLSAASAADGGTDAFLDEALALAAHPVPRVRAGVAAFLLAAEDSFGAAALGWGRRAAPALRVLARDPNAAVRAAAERAPPPPISAGASPPPREAALPCAAATGISMFRAPPVRTALNGPRSWIYGTDQPRGAWVPLATLPLPPADGAPTPRALVATAAAALADVRRDDWVRQMRGLRGLLCTCLSPLAPEANVAHIVCEAADALGALIASRRSALSREVCIVLALLFQRFSTALTSLAVDLFPRLLAALGASGPYIAGAADEVLRAAAAHAPTVALFGSLRAAAAESRSAAVRAHSLELMLLFLDAHGPSAPGLDVAHLSDALVSAARDSSPLVRQIARSGVALVDALGAGAGGPLTERLAPPQRKLLARDARAGRLLAPGDLAGATPLHPRVRDLLGHTSPEANEPAPPPPPPVRRAPSGVRQPHAVLRSLTALRPPASPSPSPPPPSASPPQPEAAGASELLAALDAAAWRDRLSAVADLRCRPATELRTILDAGTSQGATFQERLCTCASDAHFRVALETLRLVDAHPWLAEAAARPLLPRLLEQVYATREDVRDAAVSLTRRILGALDARPRPALDGLLRALDTNTPNARFAALSIVASLADGSGLLAEAAASEQLVRRVLAIADPASAHPPAIWREAGAALERLALVEPHCVHQALATSPRGSVVAASRPALATLAARCSVPVRAQNGGLPSATRRGGPTYTAHRARTRTRTRTSTATDPRAAIRVLARRLDTGSGVLSAGAVAGAVPALAALMGGDDAAARSLALELTARVARASPGTIAPVAERLLSAVLGCAAHGEPAADALAALRSALSPRALVPALVPALNADNPAARVAAARLLADLCPRAPRAVLRAVTAAAFPALARTFELSVPGAQRTATRCIVALYAALPGDAKPHLVRLTPALMRAVSADIARIHARMRAAAPRSE